MNERGLPVRVPMAQLRDTVSPPPTPAGTPPEPVVPAAPVPATPVVPAALDLPVVPGLQVVPVIPGVRDEPDPDKVSNVLSSFYGGVRRAEAEETTDLSGLAARALER
ncbi:MAG TPA: hypothetical protein VFR67_20930 [Pilimelia sp.]|nr:hypothetical protein [Pilimelia sp.]